PRGGRDVRAARLRHRGPRRLRQRARHPRRGRSGGHRRGAGRAPYRPRLQVRGGLRALPRGRPLAAARALRPLLMPRRLRGAGGAIALALLVAFPLVVTQPFPRHVMITIFLYAMLAQAWNLLAGYCGQISLGNAVFFGTGAYTSTLLLKHLGL